MTLLNRASDGLSTVLITLVRALRVLKAREEEDLKILLAPGSLAETAEEQIQQTLTRWTQLGLFQSHDGTVEIADAFKKVEYRFEVSPSLDEIRKATLTLALRAAREAGNDKADDAIVGAWWFLSTDLFEHPIQNFEDAQRVIGIAGLDPYLVQNDTRWAGLLEWMQFWGLIVQSSSSTPILPNPAECLSWHLNDLLTTDEWTPIGEFIREVSALLPIIPPLRDGATASPISEKLPTDDIRPIEERSAYLSMSLSMALHTLEMGGAIELTNRDIANQRWYFGHDERRAVTHLRRNG